MTIKIPQPVREQAAASLKRYFSANMDEELGTLGADLLLDFFIQEIGPVVYNQAVADVQQRLQARVMEVDTEVYADEFPYWPDIDRKRRHR